MARAVKFSAGGEDYALRFSFNAICDVEEVTGKKIGDILTVDGEVPMRTLRVLVWAGLTDDRPDLTQRGAGDIIDAVGIQAIGEYVEQAIVLAFPDAKPGNAPKGKAG